MSGNVELARFRTKLQTVITLLKETRAQADAAGIGMFSISKLVSAERHLCELAALRDPPSDQNRPDEIIPESLHCTAEHPATPLARQVTLSEKAKLIDNLLADVVGELREQVHGRLLLARGACRWSRCELAAHDLEVNLREAALGEDVWITECGQRSLEGPRRFCPLCGGEIEIQSEGDHNG